MTRVLIAQKHYDCSCGSSAAHSAPARAVGCIKQVEFMSHMSHKCPIPGTHDLSGIRHHVLFVRFMSGSMSHLAHLWPYCGRLYRKSPCHESQFFRDTLGLTCTASVNGNSLHLFSILHLLSSQFSLDLFNRRQTGFQFFRQRTCDLPFPVGNADGFCVSGQGILNHHLVFLFYQ